MPKELRRILVLGATGFLGGSVVEAAIKNKWCKYVRVLLKIGSKWPQSDSVEKVFYKGRWNDEILKTTLKDVDVVINCSGKVGGGRSRFDDYYESNYLTVKTLVGAINSASVKRLIHISSPAVLGAITNPKQPGTENDPFNPGNGYEYTKTISEVYVKKNCKVPWVVVRPEFVYGPGDKHVLRLYKAIKGGWFPMIGSGDSYLHPTYISDFTESIRKMINDRRAIGEVLLVAGPRPYKVRELVSEISQTFGGKTTIRFSERFARLLAAHLPLMTDTQVDFFTKNRLFSTDKLFKKLGFKPRINYYQGLLLTKNWYERERLI